MDHPATATPNGRPPRVGMAGFSAASVFHAPLITAAGGVLAAIATSNPERRANAARSFPSAQLVDDLDALLDVDGLDVIVLATPTGRHRDHALQVIAAGRPLVVDKPLGVNAAQAREVVETARTAGVPLTVFHNRRWDPAHLTARDLIRKGALGTVWRLEFNWERWRPVPLHRWRETAPAEAGGGILLDLGTHMVDAALNLLGPASAVFGELNARTTPADDDVFLSLRHDSGTVSHLTASSTAAFPAPRLRILGSAGAYVFNDFETQADAYPDLKDFSPAHCGWLIRGQEREPVLAIPGGQSDFYRAVFSALWAADPQSQFPVDPEDAVAVARILDAARDWSVQHRPDRPS